MHTFKFSQLPHTAQDWAIEQVKEKHPDAQDLDDLLALYDYNKRGDIVDYSQEGQDPEWYSDILGD